MSIVVFLVVLACENYECNKTEPFLLLCTKRVAVFRENLVSVIVSTFLLFMFVDQLLLVDVFSQLYYLTDANKNKTTMSDLPL